MTELISGYLTYVLVVVAIIVVGGGGIYLVLRPLLLWYFKIYTVVSELQENNALLREILDELRNKNIQASSTRQQPKEDYSKYMPR